MADKKNREYGHNPIWPRILVDFGGLDATATVTVCIHMRKRIDA